MRRRLSEMGAKVRETQACQAIACFTATPEFRRCKHIALFYPVRHEISLLPLAEICRAANKRVYLPALSPLPFRKIVFLPYGEKTKLRRNRFAIPEPALPLSKRIAIDRLDIVVMPLLAFGPRGERLGTGGGFYDRAFAYLRRRRFYRRPRTWAIALDSQRAELVARPWDVALQAVATPSGVIRF